MLIKSETCTINKSLRVYKKNANTLKKVFRHITNVLKNSCDDSDYSEEYSP